MVDEKLTNSSEIFKVKADKDMVTLKNVIPNKEYGIQICAITNLYPYPFPDGLWDQVPVGGMGLIGYDEKKFARVELPIAYSPDPGVFDEAVTVQVKQRSDYSIVLLVLTIIIISSTIVLCTWLVLKHRRRDVKKAFIIYEPVKKTTAN